MKVWNYILWALLFFVVIFFARDAKKHNYYEAKAETGLDTAARGGISSKRSDTDRIVCLPHEVYLHYCAEFIIFACKMWTSGGGSWNVPACCRCYRLKADRCYHCRCYYRNISGLPCEHHHGRRAYATRGFLRPICVPRGLLTKLRCNHFHTKFRSVTVFLSSGRSRNKCVFLLV